ncbi:MAG: molybdopterin-synthase adenylyltransferase MoeB [Acidobacteriota bacterium]
MSRSPTTADSPEADLLEAVRARARGVDLTHDELRRYGRHLVLPEVGVDGQKRLKAARVLLIGAGGLGSPAALYLAAAGVGTLGVVEFDQVDLSNLQRQVLYGHPDVGRPKLEVAAERLHDVNPHIEIVPHATRLELDNARELIEAYDLVVDGSDNFPTRYLVNDACVLTGTPLVWGAVLRFDGQVSVFSAPGGPCYRCLFPVPPPPGSVPSCAEGGVLGVLPGIIGSLQANEAIKLILGVGEPLVGRFLSFDALGMRLRELRLPRNPDCPACSDPSALVLHSDDASCAPPTPEPTMEATMSSTHAGDVMPLEIDVEEYVSWRADFEHVLLDVREPFEAEIATIEGALLIPLGELPRRLDELDRESILVVHCHHGGRSAQAVGFLRSQGFDRAVNLGGGIDDWSETIDSNVPRY